MGLQPGLHDGRGAVWATLTPGPAAPFLLLGDMVFVYGARAEEKPWHGAQPSLKVQKGRYSK